MRRQTIVILAILSTLGAQPARAQFIPSPRGIFGMATWPLREMLGHFHGRYRYRRHHAAQDARPGSAREPGDQSRIRLGALESPGNPRAGADASRLNAYDSVLGYAFWPKDFAGEFNRYGYADIIAAIAGPVPATDGSGGTHPDQGGTPAVCQNADGSSGDWLTERIDRLLRPDAAQRASLAALRDRVATGAETIEASCRAAGPPSPRMRLAALTQRLWAVHDAGVLARRPLSAFYASLTDDQKAKLNLAAAATPASGNDTAAAQRYRDCAGQGAGAARRRGRTAGRHEFRGDTHGSGAQ